MKTAHLARSRTPTKQFANLVPGMTSRQTGNALNVLLALQAPHRRVSASRVRLARHAQLGRHAASHVNQVTSPLQTSMAVLHARSKISTLLTVLGVKTARRARHQAGIIRHASAPRVHLIGVITQIFNVMEMQKCNTLQTKHVWSVHLAWIAVSSVRLSSCRAGLSTEVALHILARR